MSDYEIEREFAATYEYNDNIVTQSKLHIIEHNYIKYLTYG